ARADRDAERADRLLRDVAADRGDGAGVRSAHGAGAGRGARVVVGEGRGAEGEGRHLSIRRVPRDDCCLTAGTQLRQTGRMTTTLIRRLLLLPLVALTLAACGNSND